MKRTRLPYTQTKRRRGKDGEWTVHWYFVRREGTKGVRQALGVPGGSRVIWRALGGDPATDADAMRLYHRFKAGLPAADPKPKNTVSALIDSYEQSTRWPKNEGTRRKYRQTLALIREKNGEHDIKRYTRPSMIAIRDKLARESTNRADAVVTMFSIIFEHAIDKGLRIDNPAKGVARVNVPTARKPWPPALVERARERMTGPARTILELGLGTAQRLGDILAMRWSDIEDGGVSVVQQKTGEALWIPFTAECDAYLAGLPRTLNTIVADGSGQALSLSRADKALRAVWGSYGGEGFTWHGLRYSAIEALGHLTDEQIGSVSGHRSTGMIRRYAGKTRQRKLAKEARKR